MRNGNRERGNPGAGGPLHPLLFHVLLSLQRRHLYGVEQPLLLRGLAAEPGKTLRGLGDLDHRLTCLLPRLTEDPCAPEVTDDDSTAAVTGMATRTPSNPARVLGAACRGDGG
ncbi:MAG TPA: hypothetical protein VMQ46_07440 [Acidimicrobiia bacterium]|nr:hypothetical protein [Acidimicrobiia bacterium]